MSSKLDGKHILLGVTGGIAAYKAADLASRLVRRGANVRVVMTDHATQFVGSATFRAITRNTVLVGLFDEPDDNRIAHIQNAQTPDLIVVAPATANIIAKMAVGIADDMLSTILLASTVPVLMAPAMNTAMWLNPATVANVASLRQRGVEFIEPGVGMLACGVQGPGRLADGDDIEAAIVARLCATQDLNGRHVVISAGATREPLDPVRFLTNRSSGKMGCALAVAARDRGAKVTLIAAHMSVAPPAGVEVVRVSTTSELMDASLHHFDACDLFIAAAAPCDYAPQKVAEHKIKKNGEGTRLDLQLLATPDIAATLGARKTTQRLVGFAAETTDLVKHATNKLRAKNLDLIVANDVTAAGAGFEVDTNIVTLIWPDGAAESLPQLSKRDTANRIIDALVARL